MSKNVTHQSFTAPVGPQHESAPERDARLVNARGHDAVDPADIAIGVIIGRTAEFFDFFVYAIASVLVFPKLVFPYADPLTGTLYAFAIFALAFLCRPLGTTLFMALDRRFGRGTRLLLGLLLLGTATVVIGFLPGYATIGAASALCLVLFRVAQGVAWGGTWDGLSSLLALHAPARRSGWYTMLPQLGALLGLMLAAGLFAFFAGNLSAQDFLSWGWRYPFFVAFAINVVALFARLRMVATPAYTQLFDSSELQATTVPATIAREGRRILAGAFIPLASFALLHMVTVFPLAWSFLFTQESPARFLVLQMVGAGLGAITAMASATLAQRLGRRRLLAFTAVGIGLFSAAAPMLLNGGEGGQLLFVLIGFALLGVAFGQSSGVMAGTFGKAYRYTGSAITSDLAWLFGAGFAPLVALFVASQYGLAASGIYLFSGAVCTLAALTLTRTGRKAR